jgi:hypothetical protein
MMNETEAHRAQFRTEETMAKDWVNKYRADFKRLLNRGRTTSSSSVDRILQNEKAFKNKLTFDEFCHLVLPRQKV